MKILFYLLLAFCVCEASAQKGKGYTIIGELDGLEDGTWLYLKHNKDSGGSDTISRVRSKGQKFIFKGAMAHEGETYFIFIDTNKIKYPRGSENCIIVLMENKRIQIKGAVSDISKFKISVSGSKTHDEFLDYHIKVDSQVNMLNKALDKGEITWDQGSTQFKEIIWEWINNNPNSMYTPRIIMRVPKNLNEMIEAYNKLNVRAQNGKYGIILRDYIEVEKKNAIGFIAPNFRFPQDNGKELSLIDVVKLGKYTILDFWASWCAPCRKELPGLKKLFEKYHNRGLIIVGYSVDEKESAWKAALKEENLPWYNIRETEKEYANRCYGVKAIPMTYVLDNQGKIVVKGLSGEKLAEAINGLLEN